MPGIADHQSSGTTKLLLIGHSGAGKTGALASLAARGYILRILDLDNGLDILRDYMTNPASPYVKANPKVAENVSFKTITDKMKVSQGKLIPATATSWRRTVDSLVGWKDGDKDFGSITTWDNNTVLVIDSFSALATAALNFHLSLQGALGAERTGFEYQRDIGAAQKLLRSFLDTIYDENVKCNVVVTAHITFANDLGMGPRGKDNEVNVTQGFPSAIGRALSPHIPRWFNNMLIVKASGPGNATHAIYTRGQTMDGQVVSSKSAAPLRVKDSYPIDWGLADYFAAIRGGNTNATSIPPVA